MAPDLLRHGQQSTDGDFSTLGQRDQRGFYRRHPQRDLERLPCWVYNGDAARFPPGPVGRRELASAVRMKGVGDGDL
jgi:hypothetical protein